MRPVKTLQKWTILFLCYSFFSLPALALVDYTESARFKPQSSGASSVSRKGAATRSVTRPQKKRNHRGGLGLELHSGLSYDTQDVEIGTKAGKVSALAFATHIQTRYNIFLAATVTQMRSDSIDLVSEKTSFQRGNPEILLGLNWLQFGKKEELATVDLYGGLSFGQKGSDFATQRSDQIVGVSTAKRFYDLALGLGYELRLTGDPEGGELGIGNITRLSASLGWVVSHDIRFLIEGHAYDVRAGSGLGNALEETAKFGVMKPQLQLKLGRFIDFTLGATVRTRRLKDDTLLQARLWNLEGAYGSGVFTGLNINI